MLSPCKLPPELHAALTAFMASPEIDGITVVWPADGSLLCLRPQPLAPERCCAGWAAWSGVGITDLSLDASPIPPQASWRLAPAYLQLHRRWLDAAPTDMLKALRGVATYAALCPELQGSHAHVGSRHSLQDLPRNGVALLQGFPSVEILAVSSIFPSWITCAQTGRMMWCTDVSDAERHAALVDYCRQLEPYLLPRSAARGKGAWATEGWLTVRYSALQVGRDPLAALTYLPAHQVYQRVQCGLGRASIPPDLRGHVWAAAVEITMAVSRCPTLLPGVASCYRLVASAPSESRAAFIPASHPKDNP